MIRRRLFTRKVTDNRGSIRVSYTTERGNVLDAKLSEAAGPFLVRQKSDRFLSFMATWLGYAWTFGLLLSPGQAFD